MEQQRTIVTDVFGSAGSERCACRWMGFHRSAVRYVGDHRDDEALRQRLCELAEDHPRWGSPRLIWRLRQEGVRDNHKRIRRLYRLEGLAVRRRLDPFTLDAGAGLPHVPRCTERNLELPLSRRQAVGHLLPGAAPWCVLEARSKSDNAAVHRGHRASKEGVSTVIDIVENVLQDEMPQHSVQNA